VIGFYFLTSLGPASPIGAWLATHMNARLVFSFEGLLLASLLVNVPFMVQPIERAFASIAPSVREAAWVGGLSPWRTFTKIELPLAWPGVLAGVAMTAAHTLGEFGVVLMVGGSIPGETKTLSVAIYDRVQSFDDVGAHSMALALVVCSMLALIAVFSTSGSRKLSPH
jgi:molybdate transport system permease protein